MKYISLGYFCSVAAELERFGLRSESSPFDWVISDFEGVIMAIERHFSGFLDYDNLSQSKKNHEVYKNTFYNIRFYHDFDKYIPLSEQLPKVKEKYDRRINRFYDSIIEPTVFVRYISDEKMTDGRSDELIWIENNYNRIFDVLKSYNKENDIVFIANDGVCSERIKIYNVKKDEYDLVARHPVHKNAALLKLFSDAQILDKQNNINRYNEKNKFRILKLLTRKITEKMKRLFFEEYCHEMQY